MSAISPAWSVVKGGAPVITDDNGCRIIYRASHPSEATIKFDNSDLSLSNFFAEEDEVQIKIGTKFMMTGYIDDLIDVWHPSKKIDLLIHVVNWGDYLAAKRAFEKDYQKETSAHDVFLQSANSIPFLNTGINLFPDSSQKIKRDFVGTYVKDVWDVAAEVAGGDFFNHTNLDTGQRTFFAWPAETINLNEPTLNQKYKIQATPPVFANQLRPLFTKEIKFARDVSNFFRKVTVTNGVPETFPIDVDLFCKAKNINPLNNKEYSGYFTFIGQPSDYDAPGVVPHRFLPATDVGNGFVVPTLQVLVPNSSRAAIITVRGNYFDAAGNILFQLFNFDIEAYKQIRFFIRNQLTGPSISGLQMRLMSSTGAINFYSRDIYNDIKDQSGNRTNWVYLQYDTPDPANPGATGWSVNGTPTKINQIQFLFTPLTGYNVGSFVEFGKFFFYRRQRASSNLPPVSGTPKTEKMIIDNTLKNKTSLQNYANKEFTRVSKKNNKPDFTLEGNINFNHPGTMIDVDFSSLFGGSSRAVNGVRIDEIHHNLINNVHYTDVFLDRGLTRR